MHMIKAKIYIYIELFVVKLYANELTACFTCVILRIDSTSGLFNLI
jgi:hypothetical protein